VTVPPLPTSLTDGVVLRRATDGDLAAIVELLVDDPLGTMRDGGGDLGPYRRAFAAIDADPAHLLVVAEADGTVVGTLQLTLVPGLSRRGALRAQVEGVRVGRSHRGTGLGTALLGWAVEHARASRCVLVQLTSDKSRVDAQRFYERLGFVASHEGYKLAL
jgi:GNAT superfamily N-acetyltransferase